MADLLLDIARRPLAKRLVKQLRLPIPLPEPLVRATGPLEGKPLANHKFMVLGGKDSAIIHALSLPLRHLGARVVLPKTAGEDITGMLYDGSWMRSPNDLDALYDQIKPRLGELRSSSHLTLISRCEKACRTSEEWATTFALRGFVKSLSKELGRRGMTCNLLEVDPENWDASQILWCLAFLMSPRSAYVSGQILECTSHLRSSKDTVEKDLGIAWVHQLKDKTVLVTGASRGIGEAIARRLAAEGARVIGLDRATERSQLDDLMSELKGVPFVYDLTAPDGIDQIVSRLETEIGSIDILVHNAGITRDKTFSRMPRDYWDDSLGVNLKAPIQLTHALVLNDQGLIRLMGAGGRVIFMSSISGIAGNAGQTNYAAAKSGLIGYTKALAQKLAPRDITVNAIAPGFIETPMTARMPASVREIARRFNALGQGGKPEDVAEAVYFFAAPSAQGITGSVLRVCGHNLIGS